MFVVIGDWRMSLEQAGEQRSGLGRIASEVARLPGLAKGYWTRSDDGTRSSTFIVFDDRATAEAFAADVRGNFDNQQRVGVQNLSLVIHEVAAET
jgi:hypothetical protein